MAPEAGCSHDWRIVRQTRNTWREWRIMYECARYGTKKNELRKTPACTSCGADLHETREGDIEAEDALQKEVDRGMSDGLAYRCSSCKKIHILPYLE
ncbi:hypothetical protein HZC00_03615 [Candidatus Kaiserbacteria bacterium]|nr:hypothetical protein [Candidatus Kaiserbacteria bacterium]